MKTIEWKFGFLMVAVAIAATVVIVGHFDDGLLGNDHAQTISVARNLFNGKGVATNLIYYDVHYSLNPPLVPQTVFPPGYAFLVAPLLAIGISSSWSAFALCLVAFLGTGALLALSLWRLNITTATASVLASSWFFIGLNWSNVLACRSEALFAFATTAGLYCMVRWQDSRTRSKIWLIVLGVSAAAAFLTRYQGLFFIASIGLLFSIRLVFHRSRTAAVDLVLAAIVPGLVVAGVFASNALVTGSMGGGPVGHVGVHAGLADVALAYYYEFSKILGVSKGGLLKGGLSEIFAILLITFAVPFLFQQRVYRVASQNLKDNSALQLSCLYIAVSMIALIYLSVTKSPGYAQARYLSTLLPSAIYAGVAFISGSKFMSRQSPSVLVAGVVLLSGAFVFGQIRSTSEQLDSLNADHRLRDIREALTVSHNGMTIEDILRGEIGSGNQVLAHESQLAGLVLERPTYGLTPADFTDRMFDFDEVKLMAIRHNLKYVVLFPHIYDANEAQNSNRTIFTRLSNGEVPDWLELAVDSEQILLFEIMRNFESAKAIGTTNDGNI